MRLPERPVRGLNDCLVWRTHGNFRNDIHLREVWQDKVHLQRGIDDQRGGAPVAVNGLAGSYPDLAHASRLYPLKRQTTAPVRSVALQRNFGDGFP